MKKNKGWGGGVYGGRDLPLKILQNFYCPRSIMVVAALGHSDIHFDYCFDLMFHLFFISPWTVLGFQFNFEMILLRYCNYFGFQIGLLLHFTFNRSFSFVLQSRSILLPVLIYVFFYFLLNLWKIVKFWEAALGHHRGVRVLQNHFNWVDVVKSLRWQICISNLLSWNYRRIARPSDKRCRTRVPPHAGRFETSRGKVCWRSDTNRKALTWPSIYNHAGLRCLMLRPQFFFSADRETHVLEKVIIRAYSPATLHLFIYQFTVDHLPI